MKPFSREDRVAGQIKQVLADTLHKKVKDPRLTDVIITGVKLSRDLKVAKVYFVTLGNTADREKAMAGMKQAGGFLKKALGREMDLRYMPQLSFFYDESFDYGSRIDELLRSIKKADDGSNNSPTEE